jgi:signal transduction histidine kinase
MAFFLTRLKNKKAGHKELDYLIFSQQKRLQVFSQLCVISSIAALLQGLNDFITGFPFVAGIDVIIAAILFLGYIFNVYKKNHFAKMFVFIFSNISLFLFAAVVPQGVGIYLLFFPLVIFYFISFDFEHRVYSFSFTFLSLLLNIYLLATNYQPFGNINIQPVDPSLSFAINMVMSLLLISIGINYLIKMNNLGESLLQAQRVKEKKLNLTLEKTNQELDQFVYSTSHDLKAPLASIRGLLNLADKETRPVPSSISVYLKMMRERVNRLDIFIRDIIDYSRNTRLEVSRDTVQVAQLIEEVFPTINYLENADKVELISEVDPDIIVKIDKNRLIRVLVNLISNAIKYSDLEKADSVVFVKAFRNKNTLIINVEDNGIGIEEKGNEKIFDMFYRGTELAEGSGLGLYIAREMINKIGGTLDFKSKIGEGTIFTIQVPVA